jgi:hypothetical protein
MCPVWQRSRPHFLSSAANLPGMPGRTAAEAIRNYIDPIQRAVSCFGGHGNICVSSRVFTYGDFGAWSLNDPAQGMTLPQFGTFYAQQRFELVKTTEKEHADPEREPYRVSTREYIYKLAMNTGVVVEWRWHPLGRSDERRPHMHPSFDRKAHMPGPRIAIEDVIEGCIQVGAPTSCEDWKDRLLETGSTHKLYRTWVDEPPE